MKELKEQIFERFNDDYNVLCENEERAVITFDDSDISVLANKDEKKLYFLVPLTSAHKFKYLEGGLCVDGKMIKSTMYWRDYCNQVIEYQGDVPSPLKERVIDKINVNFTQ